MSSASQVTTQTQTYYIGIFTFDQQFETLIDGDWIFIETSASLEQKFFLQTSTSKRTALFRKSPKRSCLCLQFFIFHKTQSFFDMRMQKDCI